MNSDYIKTIIESVAATGDHEAAEVFTALAVDARRWRTLIKHRRITSNTGYVLVAIDRAATTRHVEEAADAITD